MKTLDQSMLISVITPTFNSQMTILKSLESVKKQTYSNYEHIFIDNLSTDKTKDLIDSAYASTNIKYSFHSERDNGIADAFNKGIQHAQGDIIAILNSDDYYCDENLFLNIIAKFKQNEEIEIVHGDIIFEDEKLGTNLRKPLLCPVQVAMPFNHPTMFIKKMIYEKFGLFNTEYRYAMDYELICRFYISSSDTNVNFHYFENHKPFVKMAAGGASDTYELKTLEEIKKALILHKKFNNLAEKSLTKRRIRIRIKRFLLSYNLDFVVKIWRYLKWRS